MRWVRSRLEVVALHGFPIVLVGTPGSVLEEVVDLGVERVVEVSDHVLRPLITQFAVVLTPLYTVSRVFNYLFR